MKTFTVKDLRKWGACYDPTKYLKEDWQGTALDLLKIKEIPFQDCIWAVTRIELINEKLMRLFAVWCYRQTLAFIKDPDTRSIEAANVAERYANGQATAEELSAARCGAESAARSAARSAWYSAWSAAWSAADSAAWSAVEYAARSAACYAARSAIESAQREKLIEMLEKEGK